MSRLNFKLEAVATGSRARAATFRTLHNEVKTPVFMPVGTRATVRAQSFETLRESGSQVLLANTYHLLLRPGPEVFRKMGGIHGFMKWDRSVLTDSGGFQIFSLTHARDMKEEGAEFRSYLDHSRILLTPELSIDTQKAIGSDIMMVLDQCVPSTSERSFAEAAMHLTHRWAKRSLEARGESPQSLFGIVQGACFEDLRRESARVLTEMPFDGFAIGGLAVGETKVERETFTEFTTDLLPRNLPRYLMGVGTPIDLLEAVHRGVDMFDCILPTALAQQGVAYTGRGRLNLRRGVYRLSDDPVEAGCDCPTCRTYSRGYLHHLTKSEEILGWSLLGAHNLHFYHRLMGKIRSSILDDSFVGFYRENRDVLHQGDEENPSKLSAPKRRKTLSRTLGDYEVHTAPAGFSSIRQRSSGEIMHSVVEPSTEARAVYIEQSGLLADVLMDPAAEWLMIWDVGLGAGTNAMAAIHAIEERTRLAGGLLRPVRIVSFETDLDSLRLATRHAALFPHLRHKAPFELLEKGSWTSGDGRLSWSLLEGDFLAKMAEAPAPDLIFFDPFSYKTDSNLWTLECFERVFRACAGRDTALFTYSNSTAVRTALLAAGFRVAAGVGTGPKKETTIALAGDREAPNRRPLLGQEWLVRWERSGSRLPPGLPADRATEVIEKIRLHRQFVDASR